MVLYDATEDMKSIARLDSEVLLQISFFVTADTSSKILKTTVVNHTIRSQEFNFRCTSHFPSRHYTATSSTYPANWSAYHSLPVIRVVQKDFREDMNEYNRAQSPEFTISPSVPPL